MFEAFKQAGCAIFFVSHDMEQIKTLCDEAIWLHEGHMKASGNPAEVVEKYLSFIQQEKLNNLQDGLLTINQLNNSGDLLLNVNGHDNENSTIKVTKIELFDYQQQPVDNLIHNGDSLIVQVNFIADALMSAPIFTIAIRRSADHQLCFNSNSTNFDLLPTHIEGQASIALTLERLDLPAGDYYVDVGIYSKDWSQTFDYQWQGYYFSIAHTNSDNGFLNPPYQWHYNN